MSALLIVNTVFRDFEDPLLTTIRDFMISKGATELEEDIIQPNPPLEPVDDLPTSETTLSAPLPRSRLQHIPLIRKALATQQTKKLTKITSAI